MAVPASTFSAFPGSDIQDIERVIGPCLIFLGDPTKATPALGGMKFIGPTDGGVKIAVKHRITGVKADQAFGGMLSDSVYAFAEAPRITMPLLEERKKLLEQFIPSGVNRAGAFTFGSDMKKVATQTLCLLPLLDRRKGIESDLAFWFPRAVSLSFGDFMMGVPDNESGAVVHEDVFASLFTPQDQAGTEIPYDARYGWIGQPVDVFPEDPEWTLPAPEGFADVGEDAVAP